MTSFTGIQFQPSLKDMGVGCSKKTKTAPVITSTPIKRRRDSSSKEEEAHDKADMTFNLSNTEHPLETSNKRYSDLVVLMIFFSLILQVIFMDKLWGMGEQGS